MIRVEQALFKARSSRLPEVRKIADEMAKAFVTVGVHNDAGSYPATKDEPNPPTVAEVAVWQEYGTQHIPARPFFYPPLKEKQDVISKMLGRNAALALLGRDPVWQALGKIGFAVQVWVQNRVRSDVQPALSEGYLKSRREEYPGAGARTLVRSGLLLRSIRFKVFIGDKDVFDGPQSGSVQQAIKKNASLAKAAGGSESAAAMRQAARAAGESFRSAQRDARGAAKAFAKQHFARFNAQQGVKKPLGPQQKGH